MWLYMEEELQAYFFHFYGVRSIRYAPPELVIPIHRMYKKLSKENKEELKTMYEKNKSKVFKLLEL